MKRFKDFDCSTPIRPGKQNFISDGNLSTSEIGSSPKILKKASYLDMIIEAIKAIGLPRKGASYVAIKKWIIANKEIGSRNINFYLKSSISKGLEGILRRSPRSAECTGMTGSFMLAEKKPLKSTKTTVKKTEMKKPSKITSETKAGEIATKKVKSTTLKAPSKAKTVVTKKRSTKGPSKPKAGKKSVEDRMKVPLKAKTKAGKKPATKQPLNANTEAREKLVTKAPAKKKPADGKMKAIEAPSKATSEKKAIINASPKAKTVVTKKPSAKVPQNAKANKKPATKAPSTAKTQDGKAKKAVNKKLYNSTAYEQERQELSDTEIAVQKNPIGVLKSFFSDTELEVSKKEEKKTKRNLKKLPIRAKKVTSKV